MWTLIKPLDLSQRCIKLKIHKEGLEKMAEMMRSWCRSEGDMANCYAMMKKMTQQSERKETEKKKDTQKTD
jgi:hypothetical protein